MSFAFTFSFGFRLGLFWPLFAARAFIFRPSLWAGRGREREGGDVGADGGSSSELGIWAYINFRHVKFVMLYFFVKQLPTHKYSSNYRCVCVCV